MDLKITWIEEAGQMGKKEFKHLSSILKRRMTKMEKGCRICGILKNLWRGGEGTICYNCLRKKIEDEMVEYAKKFNEIDHRFNPVVVCPYCGCKDDDSWEITESGEYTCGHCESDYFVERNVEVTYSTSKISEIGNA